MAPFFERTDRWSSALQGLGVGPGDRVALIAPNTHAMVEQLYYLDAVESVRAQLPATRAFQRYEVTYARCGSTASPRSRPRRGASSGRISPNPI
jgi:hypothetical protein